MSRAIRRHHLKRIKEKTTSILKNTWSDHPDWINYYAPRLANNRAVCSSIRCCGNPRKLGVLSLKEVQANLSMREQLNDLTKCSETNLNW